MKSRSLIAAILAALVLLRAPIANAAPIDSSASGVYLGTDRVCRMVFSATATHTRIDQLCILHNGNVVFATPVYYTFGTPCATTGATPLGSDVISLQSMGLATLAVIRNGNYETWTRVVALPSPGPYSCAPAVGNKPRG